MEQQVRNREAAGIQITAEQIIKDARSQFGDTSKAVAGSSYFTKDEFKIQDKEELNEFLQNKRKEYEDRIRRHRKMPRAYLDYARFEAAQNDYRRCRSVLERGINVLSSEPSIWLAYSEIEAKGGFMNHALNVLNRATALLPRVDSLWFRYVLYQESAGGPTAQEDTRAVFERWMAWEPEAEEPWFAYTAFEERHSQVARARDVYERYCGTHPTSRAYIKYAKWEDAGNRIANARNVFERAVGAAESSGGKSELPDTELIKPEIWLAFALFEQKRNEPERARAVYQHSLDRVSSEYRGRVFAQFAAFEKRLKETTTGLTDADTIVVLRRKEEYEKLVGENPKDYDAWFDLLRLEESQSQNADKIRATYLRAEANVPDDKQDKSKWRRFVYLFIYESLFEELTMKDMSRARQALKKALDVVPHKKFTFAKLWVMAAHLELRANKDLVAVRKLLGKAIGLCPKDKLFRSYIQLELQLGQLDRCRTLYEKYLTFNPANSQAWSKFAEMERAVGETKRARSIYELGVNQPVLDEPDKLWLRYIDFEVTCDDDDEDGDEDKSTTGRDRARKLYERLLTRTEEKQPRVWIAMAKFLSSFFTAKDARDCLERAEKTFKSFGSVGGSARAQICEARVELERSMLASEQETDRSHLQSALEQVPKKVERISEDGAVSIDYLFPVDVAEEAERKANDTEAQKRAATLKLLDMAAKRQKVKQSQEPQ